MANTDIREAAESLLGSFSNIQQQRNISQTTSVNILTEELIAGHRYSGRMSTVRRFFCLFVTFDMLFTGLLWLICVMIRGETLVQIFDSEIIHYNIKTSLFDIVIVAILRFILLLLFYALFYINNWSVIALSTAGTCAFLMGKVFLYDWPNASEPVYQVFLILTSFTLSWSEAWFLDFRVLPQELQAKQIISAITGQHSGRESQAERAPLLGGFSRAPHSQYGGSTNWFSPVDTPELSPRVRRADEQVILTQEQIDEYKSKADHSLQESFRILNLPNWRLEKRGEHRTDLVESIETKDYGKVYRFTGPVDCPAKFLYEEVRDNLTRMPEWNPTILKSELIKQISSGIDLSYQVTAGGGKGLITPRDFVILRRAARLASDGSILTEDDPTEPYAYLSSGVSVKVPGYPPNNVYVRGENKVGCWCMKPSMSKTSSGKLEPKCTFQWLMSCDLKGRIPQFVIDTALATVMLEYVVYVRKLAVESKAKGLFW